MAESAETVAGAVSRTICMVETTAQAEAVIAGEHGIIQRARPGHIVACMSTIDPLVARCIGDALLHAFKGELDYRYNEKDDLLRVSWSR